MFFNVSNHPTTKWGIPQKEAAYDLGGDILVDIPFPNVPPEMGTDGIVDLARQILEKIRGYCQHEERPLHENRVMVQGEASLCFELTTLLHKWGIQVVVATSERMIVNNEDGTKTAQFNFVQFRNLRG